MSINNAVIIIDSGFSQEAVVQVKHLIGFYDLNSGVTVTGAPFIAGDQAQFVLNNLCGDSLNHGSIILQRLLDLNPDCAFVLVRAFDQSGSLLRTRWHDGKVASDGWIEAYLWARQLCQSRGLTSVANLSFGGFGHAQDGSGWESHKLSSVAAAGHVLVAATGPGDGRAIHCSFTASENTVVNGYQRGTSTYNLWVNRNVSCASDSSDGSEISGIPEVMDSSRFSQHSDWHMRVKLNGREVAQHQGRFIPANIWNGRQQLKFVVEGEGSFEFSITPAAVADASLVIGTRFDIFVAQENETRFFNYIDEELVSEPACLPQVVAVGLENGSYGHCRIEGVSKPELKLSGRGPISFRIPEVTFAVASLLEAEPTLDISQVRQKLLAQFA